MAGSKESFAQRLIRWFTLGGGEDTTVLLTADSNAVLSEVPQPLGKRYEVIKVLGKGAFGVVYLAKDLRIGRLLAMKQLYGKYSESAEIHHRFLQEARIAGQIDNPNIVTIFDVHEEGGVPCILMEYLAGGNLSTTLRLDAPLPERTALDLIQGILNGLAAAHRMGVIHRDIKPPNILFDQTGTPKISDFGVAHLPREAGGIDVDASRHVAGTPCYMAPEQLHSDGQAVDARADLYAAGLMLYEMVTGERFHEFRRPRSMSDLLGRIKAKGPPGNRDYPEGVSSDTKRLIARLLEINPDRRYPNAGIVLRDVEDLLDAAEKVAEVKETAAGIDESRPEMFEDILRLFLVDGVVSAPERRELSKRAKRLGISVADAMDLEENVRREFDLPLLSHLQDFEWQAEKLLKDREYSEDDVRILRQLGEKYGITVDEQRKIEDNVMIKFKMKEGVEEELIP